jgi:hypothetical protein
MFKIMALNQLPNLARIFQMDYLEELQEELREDKLQLANYQTTGQLVITVSKIIENFNNKSTQKLSPKMKMCQQVLLRHHFKTHKLVIPTTI